MDMYIADTHLGHEHILSECRPQFASIEEMDAAIIDGINRKMTRNDTLYILGDFAYRSRTPVIEYLNAIKPRKVLIKGNHDEDWLNQIPEAEKSVYFAGIHDRLHRRINKREMHLDHYPSLAWNRSHFFGQSIAVCGHIHARREGTIAAELFPLVRCQFNAGADINHFEPVTLAELVRNNMDFYGFRYTDEEWAILCDTVERLTV